MRDELKAWLDQWLEETAQKMRAIANDTASNELRIEGMKFTVDAVKDHLDAVVL